jgi:group I intron endonuclease
MKESNQFIIYKVTNIVDGKVYIGQTATTLSERWAGHIRKTKAECPYCLARAIRKYGLDNFVAEEVCRCLSKSELNAKEIELIKALNTKAPAGYNMTDGGEGNLGFYPSGETRAKMGRAHKGNKYSLGVRPSEETRAKLSKARMGNTNSLGVKHSAETKGRISKSLMGNKHMLGKHLSSEAKAKVSKFQKGRPKSEETKAKISAACMGRKVTDETREKIAESWIGRRQKENLPIATNRSGIRGVSWHKTASKWRAGITINNKTIHLGLFDDLQEAGAAYLKAKQEMNNFQVKGAA